MVKKSRYEPADMDPETAICMRKIFEALEDARLRGESDTSSLGYLRHTKMKKQNQLALSGGSFAAAMAEKTGFDPDDPLCLRAEFVVRGLGTTADVPEPEMLSTSPRKTPRGELGAGGKKRKKKKKKKKKRKGGADEGDERELFATPDGRVAAFEIFDDGVPTNTCRIIVEDDAGKTSERDVGADEYASTGYAPLESLLDDEKAALGSLLCLSVVDSPLKPRESVLDDLPRPFSGNIPDLGGRPPSPTTAAILAELDEDD